jgi:hypothetical protein
MLCNTACVVGSCVWHQTEPTLTAQVPRGQRRCFVCCHAWVHDAAFVVPVNFIHGPVAEKDLYGCCEIMF